MLVFFRLILNLALAKKLADVFCLFFTYRTYVTGLFFPFIFLHPARKAIFQEPKELVGIITYEPLVGLHSNLIGLFSGYF